MDSYFARLYLDLQKRIAEKVPEIAWIEQDFRQEENDAFRPDVAFPAVLIDFPESGYSALCGYSQMAAVTVSLRLFFAPFTQSYFEAPQDTKEDALQYFEIEQKLINALHGWEPGEYSQPLIRASASSDNRNTIGLRIRILLFTTEYEEYRD